MVKQQLPLGLLNIETEFAGRSLTTRNALAQIHECKRIPDAITKERLSETRIRVRRGGRGYVGPLTKLSENRMPADISKPVFRI